MQREFNSITTFVGMSLNQAATGLPSWASNNIGASGNSVKTRVEAVQSAVETLQDQIDTKIGWTLYNFDYTDFSTAATSTTVTVVTLAQNTHIGGVVIKHSTAFAGSGITDYKVSFGPSGDVTRYVDEFDVDQTVATSAFQSLTLGDVPYWGTTGALVIQAVSTGANLSAASGGVVDVWVLTSALPSP